MNEWVILPRSAALDRDLKKRRVRVVKRTEPVDRVALKELIKDELRSELADAAPAERRCSPVPQRPKSSGNRNLILPAGSKGWHPIAATAMSRPSSTT
jgi:hypothetical protein